MKKHVECVTDLAKDIGNERDIGVALTYTIIGKKSSIYYYSPNLPLGHYSILYGQFSSARARFCEEFAYYCSCERPAVLSVQRNMHNSMILSHFQPIMKYVFYHHKFCKAEKVLRPPFLSIFKHRSLFLPLFLHFFLFSLKLFPSIHVSFPSILSSVLPSFLLHSYLSSSLLSFLSLSSLSFASLSSPYLLISLSFSSNTSLI